MLMQLILPKQNQLKNNMFHMPKLLVYPDSLGTYEAFLLGIP